MTTPRFIPFGLEDDKVEAFFALTEELSEATMQLLRDWIVASFGYRGNLGGARLVAYASEARLDLDVETAYDYDSYELRQLFPRTNDLLGLIQFLLCSARDDARIVDLNTLLWRGHSIWTAARESPVDPYRIVRRLPEGVVETVRNVASMAGLAGQKLTKAWNYAYGLTPDASASYSSAIKAVETLACPMIDPGATLGRAIGKLYKEASDWTFVLTEPNPSDRHPVIPVEVVASNMKMLWRGQVDRHGSDPSDFREVTADEARAAVLLAATLVGWLNNGYLVKS